MGALHKIGAASLTALVAVAFSSGSPAHAATTPETYLGSASGTALVLGAFGQSATLGASTAKVDSTFKAVATGAGQLLDPKSQVKAEVVESGKTETKPEACAVGLPDSLAQLKAAVDVGIACSKASVTTVDGNPVAIGEGTVASLDVAANSIINQVPLPIGDTLAQIVNALKPVTNQVPPAQNLIDVLQSILKTKTIEATLGGSVSSVTTAANTVTSVSNASGATIKLLPTPTVAGQQVADPVVTIIVGQAQAKAVYDRSTGKAEPSYSPALVTIAFNKTLGLPAVTVAPGQTQEILKGTPLESRIIVADGSKVTNPDGSVGAVADGVRLELLKGVQGGITLSLAHAEAGVAGKPAVTVVRAPELPRTGGIPMLPLAGGGMLAVALAGRRLALLARR